MNKNGRVAVVGTMSQYNLENPEKGRMLYVQYHQEYIVLLVLCTIIRLL